MGYREIWTRASERGDARRLPAEIERQIFDDAPDWRNDLPDHLRNRDETLALEQRCSISERPPRVLH